MFGCSGWDRAPFTVIETPSTAYPFALVAQFSRNGAPGAGPASVSLLVSASTLYMRHDGTAACRKDTSVNTPLSRCVHDFGGLGQHPGMFSSAVTSPRSRHLLGWGCGSRSVDGSGKECEECMQHAWKRGVTAALPYATSVVSRSLPRVVGLRSGAAVRVWFL